MKGKGVMSKEALDLGLRTFRKEVTRSFARQWGLQHLRDDEKLAAWWVFSPLTDENEQPLRH